MSSSSNVSPRSQEPGGSIMMMKRKRNKNKQSDMGNMTVAQMLKLSQLKQKNGEDVDGEEEEARYSEDGIDQDRLKLSGYEQSTIRIVAQFLHDLGLRESVDKIVEESGCTVENSNAARLRTYIRKGKYDEAVQTIEKCTPIHLSKEIAEQAKFYLYCFKLSSLVRRKQMIEAVYLMRELSKFYGEKIKELLNAYVLEIISFSKTKSSNITDEEFCQSQLNMMQDILPSKFMLPSNRLRSILEMVTTNNGMEADGILLKDAKHDSPTKSKSYKCVQVCSDHDSEVWSVKFSNDGKMLASGSTGNDIIIWKVRDGKLIKCGRLDPSGDDFISGIEWSYNNKFVAVCGNSQSKYNLTVFNAETRSIHRVIRVQCDDMTVGLITYYSCCSFFNSPQCTMLIAGTENGTMRVYNMDAPEESHLLKSINGFRVRCVYGYKDGRRMLAADSHNRLRMYYVDDDTEYTLINEEATLITFTMHPSEQLLLTTTNINLRLWDLKSRTLIRYFSGACQQDSVFRFVVHGSFGGVNQGFIATGTIGESSDSQPGHRSNQKDGRVCIWDFDDCRPIMRLKGHRGPVNAVSWNPRDPTMLASCSDDGTVCLWNIDKNVTNKSSSILPKRVRRSMKKTTSKDTCIVAIKANGNESNGSANDWSIQPNIKKIVEFYDNAEFDADLVFEQTMIEKSRMA